MKIRKIEEAAFGILLGVVLGQILFLAILKPVFIFTLNWVDEATAKPGITVPFAKDTYPASSLCGSTVSSGETRFEIGKAKYWGSKEEGIKSYDATRVLYPIQPARFGEKYVFFKAPLEYIGFQIEGKTEVSPILMVHFQDGENGFLFILPEREGKDDRILLYQTIPSSIITRVVPQKRGDPLLLKKEYQKLLFYLL